MSLSKWLNEFEKKHAKGKEENKIVADRSVDQNIERISTGSIIADYLTNGGWAKGHINEITGWKGVGKTTLCGTTTAWVQKNLGKGTVYMDAERVLSNPYFQTLGVNFDPDLWAKFKDQTTDKVQTIIKSTFLNAEQNNVGLIVLDSAGAVVPPEWMTEEGKAAALGERARFWSDFIPGISGLADKTGITFLFVNQLRRVINTMSYLPEDEKEKPQGGEAIEFFKTISMKMKSFRKTTKDETDPMTGQNIKVPLGNLVQMKVIKNKAGGAPFRQGYDYIEYGKGFNNYKAAASIFLHRGTIDKEGAGRSLKYKFLDEKGQSVIAKTRDELEILLTKYPKLCNQWLQDLGFKYTYF